MPDGRLPKEKNPMKPNFYKQASKSTVFFCVAAMALTMSLHANPLKVSILAGQSNMEGHAQTMTFPAIAKDPETADIHQRISNQGFHYHGSAKFFAQAGKAFAEALVDLKKP